MNEKINNPMVPSNNQTGLQPAKAHLKRFS
jgi:hypothetical protein